MKIVFSVPITSYIPEMPPIIQDLGLGYLAAAVRKDGHEAAIRDWNMPPSPEDFIDYLKNERPHVIAIKVFTKDVGAAAKTIEAIKSAGISSKIVVGGPHPSAAKPEEIFEDLKGIDFAIRGEGEEGLPMLLRHLSAPDGVPPNEALNEIPGLVWIKDGFIKSNPVKFTELSKVGLPAWDLLNPAEYPPLMGLNDLKSGYSSAFITSRGCPGNCSFCSVKLINGSKIRRKPLKEIIDELSLLYFDYGVRFLIITDNGFLVDEEFVQEMCAAMIEKGLKFEWDCVLIDKGHIVKEKTVKMMKKAGCVMVNLGIESGSERIRKAVNKKSSLDAIRDTVLLFNKHKIDVFGFFMAGFPSETRAEMQESIAFARSLPLKKVSFSMCYPIPGTRVYRYLLDKYKLEKMDWASFNINSSQYPLSEMESKSLFKLVRRANLEFMMRKEPGYLIKKTVAKSVKLVKNMLNHG